MVDYEAEDGVDGANALEKAINALRNVTYEQNDLNFFFNQVEIKLQTNGVKKQWSKLQALTTVLPKEVIDELKPLLSKKESQFPDRDAYLKLKTEILRIFSPPEDADFERAMSRVLSGKPSQLARALVNDLCNQETHLDGCCCSKFIFGLWKRQLPSGVKQKIASEPFTKENFQKILKLADDAYQSCRPSQSVAAVATSPPPFVTPANPGPLDTAFHPAFNQEGSVAAYGYGNRGGRGGRGGGRGGQGGGRGNRGAGRGQGNQQNNRGQGNSGGGGNRGQGNQGRGGSAGTHPRHGTTRHADLPPFETCKRHWTFGKSAFFCLEPGTCPWKDFYTPRSNN